MSLKKKFNLMLLLVGVVGLGITGGVSYTLLQQHAREEVLETASVMMESALAVRSYTVDEIRPLLIDHPSDEFLAQTVPAYAASQYVRNLQRKHPDFHYKEAALNPTNPINRATSWEADIVEWFRSHDNAEELAGERETPTGLTFFLARPIRITNPDCLVCHDTPDRAPEALLARYGNSNGFGWKLNTVVGAQIVSVPQALPLARADQEFFVFMGALLGVFVLVGILLNILLQRFVIKPVARIAEHADQVSMGTLELPEIQVKGEDEIASLGRSFNRMQRSLGNAVTMLNETMDQ